MRRLKILLILITCLVGVFAVSWFGIEWYMDITRSVRVLEKENAQLKKKPALITDEDIIARVSTFMVLPEGTPKVVPITDIETLRESQPFFENAKNGDRLLVFPTRVILYSPALDKIVEVAVVK